MNKAIAALVHVNWCFAQYRSYRAHDNTFQPMSVPVSNIRHLIIDTANPVAIE